MSIFVLVHGAWHGKWVWDKIIPLLEEGGHGVFALELPYDCDTGLSDHIAKVSDLIVENKLTNIILVGHSYGGMVISGVADVAFDRILRLVYLDAFVPKDGESLFDIVQNPYVEFPEFFPPPSPEKFGIEKKVDLIFVSGRYKAQPTKTFTDKIFFSNISKLQCIRKVYIHCLKSNFDKVVTEALNRMANVAKSNEGEWSYFDIDAGHSCMITNPDILLEILLQII